MVVWVKPTGAGPWKCTIAVSGNSAETWDVYGAAGAAPVVDDGTTPYGGTPLTIAPTGITRNEAENFKSGANGVAYFDTDGNVGSSRATAATPWSTSPAATVGWTQPGEWLKYTVTVAMPGVYALRIITACPFAGGVFHVEIDGGNVTGALDAPNPGDWYAFESVSGGHVTLSAGRHVCGW